MWLVQVSKNAGRYSTRYSMNNESQAAFYYGCLNVHSGYNKRLINPAGKVVARERTG